MLTSKSNRRRLGGEALESRALMAGLTLSGLSEAPTAEVAAKADATDIYAFVSFGSGGGVVAGATEASSAEAPGETSSTAETSPAGAAVDQAFVEMYQAGESAFARVADVAETTLSGVAGFSAGQTIQQAAGTALAVGRFNSEVSDTGSDVGQEASSEADDGFQGDLLDLQRDVNSQPETNSMIANMQKARHEPMMATVSNIR